MPSRRMESTTIDSCGDVKIVGNNLVKSHVLNRNKSGNSSLVANRVMSTLRRSMDAVPSGYSDN